MAFFSRKEQKRKKLQTYFLPLQNDEPSNVEDLARNFIRFISPQSDSLWAFLGSTRAKLFFSGKKGTEKNFVLQDA